MNMEHAVKSTLTGRFIKELNEGMFDFYSRLEQS